MFLIQIVFDISVWFHFGITLILQYLSQILQYLWPNFSNGRTRTKISNFVKPVLRNQYICLEVCINSYFDPFPTNSVVCDVRIRTLLDQILGLDVTISQQGWGDIRILWCLETYLRNELLSSNIAMLLKSIFLSLLVYNV